MGVCIIMDRKGYMGKIGANIYKSFTFDEDDNIK